ncbi:MAG: bile acid:sodium symporter family protein [Pirellulaceae bacterium]
MDIGLVFVGVTVFTLMLTIGVNQSFDQLTSLWRQPGILIRSLLAVIVLVPVVALILLWVFDLPPEVATGLAVLAAAPGAPLTTKRSQMAAADVDYITSLQLTLALSAVFVTPCILAIFYAIFELQTERVNPLQLVWQIASVTFLPVVIGLLLQRIAPQFVKMIRQPINVIANVLFLLLVVALVVAMAVLPEARAKLLVGWPAITAIVLMAVAALTIGHLLGGPRLDYRGGLAVACIARNLGLAAYIVGLGESSEEMIPTLLAYAVVGAALAIPYSIWIKRILKAEGDSEKNKSEIPVGKNEQKG